MSRELKVVKKITINEREIEICKLPFGKFKEVLKEVENVDKIRNSEITEVAGLIEGVQDKVCEFIPTLDRDFIDTLYIEEIAEILGELVNANFTQAQKTFMLKANMYKG